MTSRQNKLECSYSPSLFSGLFYKKFMIVIYDHNDCGQYYKTRITIVFTILAKAANPS